MVIRHWALGIRGSGGARNTNYRLSASPHVLLRIYDVQGSFVRTLAHEEQRAGQYTLPWDGRDRDGMDVALGGAFLPVVGRQG